VLSTGATVAVIQPARRVDPGDVLALLELTEAQSNLLVAGVATSAISGCLGYRFDFTILDSLQVVGPSGAPRGGAKSTFAATSDTVRAIPAGLTARIPCPSIPVLGVDTLLRTVEGAAVALRIRRSDSPRVILLVSDAMLLGTQGRRTPELPALLGRELMGHSRHLVFDEYHQVGAGGSLPGPPWQWSPGG
jgi:hypothetical protein